ncbi:MAG: diguanylate cyclase, partial [Proteobacteria bacterium]|nr:diguanylate cyclase [Pseudomonadota bacterium]
QQTSDPVVQDFIHGLESGHEKITGIESQYLGEKRVKEEMARLQRHDTAFSLIVFTVQNLDEINEKLGPTAGLTVIKNLAGKLQILTRLTDTCYRFGLNKIILVLPNTNKEQARVLCEKLAGQMKGKDILGASLDPGFCFFISAGYTEGQKQVPYEELLFRTEAIQNTFYEFSVC